MASAITLIFGYSKYPVFFFLIVALLHSYGVYVSQIISFA